MKMLLSILMSLSTLMACNLMSPERRPASDFLVTDEPVAFGIIKLSTIEKGLHEIAKASPMIESIDYFNMDPATRRIRIKLTAKYPLESLFTFSKIPDENKNDLHVIDMTLSLPETKTLAYTRYLGLQFHNFKIDGDEYINAFSVVIGTIKTLLANSNLVDYLYTKTEEQLQNADQRLILREILDNNGIVPIYASNKINFKVNLAQFASLSPYIEDYKNLNLWRFSPTLFQGEEIRFKIIAGEGEPSDKWMNSQKERIADDTRTLLQVREDLYLEYSHTGNVGKMAQDYMKEALEAENIFVKKLDNRFQKEISEHLYNLEVQAKDILSRNNQNFIADPEFEYIEYTSHVKNSIRNFVADLDRRLSIHENILAGGKKNSDEGPLVTKFISEQVLNGSMNFLVDMEVDKVQVIKEFQMFMLPQLPGVELRGKLNLPLEYMLGQMDSTLQSGNYVSKLEEIEGGIPFSLTLEKVMKDNGILGLDIKRLTLLEGSKKLVFNRSSKNQAFMMDMLKVYVAQLVASENMVVDDEVDEDLKRKNEILQIKKYVSAIQDVYRNSGGKNSLYDYYKSDLEYNPFIVAGEEHVKKKKDILLGDFVSYNEQSKLFETRVDASIVMDSINNVKLDLQLWDLTPLYSKELDNTFMRLDVGSGVRSQKFIDEMYSLRGQAENAQFSGIYYDLGKERTPVDLLMSLDFNYVESYVNRFLADMVKANEIGIIEQAEKEPGKTFYEIQHISLDINEKKELVMDLKIKSAKKSKGFLNMWGKRLKEDSYSISAKLELSSKEIDIENPKSSLAELRYFKEVISLNPKDVKIKIGKPTLVDSAITGLLNSVTSLALNNHTVKKLLLKITNKFLTKMYSKKDGDILGHEIEKSARIYTTDNELLVLLNPRLGGPSYDVHLTGKGNHLYQAVKLEPKSKKLHVAMTASVGMAKTDKKELMHIFKELNQLVDPLLELKDKTSLQTKLINDKVFDKLLVRSDAGKEALYKRFISVMSKYDQVLQTTDIVGAERSLKQKISATGSELIYFASLGHHFAQKLSLLTTKMKKLGLTDTNSHYQKFMEAQNKAENNITKPLVAQYKQRAHIVNKAIIQNKISYWTYLFYADAYFAEMAYQQILSH